MIKIIFKQTYGFRRIIVVALSGVKNAIDLILAEPLLVVLILLLSGGTNLNESGIFILKLNMKLKTNYLVSNKIQSDLSNSSKNYKVNKSLKLAPKYSNFILANIALIFPRFFNYIFANTKRNCDFPLREYCLLTKRWTKVKREFLSHKKYKIILTLS